VWWKGPKGGGGVSPFSGEVQLGEVDLAIPGRGLDFVWGRTYNSRIGRTGSSVNGWTFSYDVRCSLNSSGGVDVYDGTGRKDTFKLQASGVYSCPEFFREGTLSGGVFRLTFADTGYWSSIRLILRPRTASSPYCGSQRKLDVVELQWFGPAHTNRG